MPPKRGAVTVVIPVMDPNAQYLAETINSVSRQDYPVKEVLLVDASQSPVEVNSDVPVRVLHKPGLGIGASRREGVKEADTKYVAHLDEDAVLLDRDYFSEAVGLIQKPGVSAAGGTVFPIRGNSFGRAIAVLDRLNPSDLGTHYLVHEVQQTPGGAGIPVGMGRGEDITIRRQLKQFGQVERMSDKGALKDLPTSRQSAVRDLLVSTASGALAGVLTSFVQDRLRGIQKEFVNEVM